MKRLLAFGVLAWSLPLAAAVVEPTRTLTFRQDDLSVSVATLSATESTATMSRAGATLAVGVEILDFDCGTGESVPAVHARVSLSLSSFANGRPQSFNLLRNLTGNSTVEVFEPRIRFNELAESARVSPLFVASESGPVLGNLFLAPRFALESAPDTAQRIIAGVLRAFEAAATSPESETFFELLNLTCYSPVPNATSTICCGTRCYEVTTGTSSGFCYKNSSGTMTCSDSYGNGAYASCDGGCGVAIGSGSCTVK